MRELKFRAWDNKKNRWMTNYEDCYLNEHGDVLVEVTKGDITALRLQDAIVEQYTGLKDKNGTGVYEGDIYRDSNGELRVVSFEEDIDTDRFWQFAVGWLFDFPNSGIEIIGNIHETPELLEKV